jgi:CheY-like chemotaxis protein
MVSIKDDDLDQWFWRWARNVRDSGIDKSDGIYLIHAHGRFTQGAHRQDLQGVELLKHIRLTPWLGVASTWHAIVYSFEPLEAILARRPGDLILTSPGVTFLQLPRAVDLQNGLIIAHPDKAWRSLNLPEILADLAKNHAAVPSQRNFRSYIAADYSPPGSAHQISNWWGIYEMFLAFSGVEHPEYAKPDLLPPSVREFVLRLNTKKAAWLEGTRPVSAAPPESLQQFRSELNRLILAAVGRTIVYVDDEANNGWLAFLGDLLNENPTSPACTIAVPEAGLLRLCDKRKELDAYKQQVDALAQWVNSNEPALLILDLRLLGSRESLAEPDDASGMDLARAVRSSNRYVPILLFTASNKAETLLISQSLDIDDYWMKPGMGEHRGLGAHEADLVALTRKLTTLLGEDYSWLQRVGREIVATRRSLKQHWWERTVRWPGPSEIHPPQPDIQVPAPNVRDEVLRYIDSILYTARLIHRMRNAKNALTRSLAAGTPPDALPDSVCERLCAALFNHIGQVIELVHDVSDKASDPFGSKSGNARIGGYFDSVFVFRRGDWWAFYLFAWRNNFSHPGAIAHFQDVKRAVSDLVAWLTCGRIQGRLLTRAHRDAIAARMLATPLRSSGRAFPVLRLMKNEREGWITVGTQSISCENPGGPLAQDGRFREQLAMRPEFDSLVKQSEQLFSGP